jgi:nucleotide-binding universal stress UspA family protein
MQRSSTACDTAAAVRRYRRQDPFIHPARVPVAERVQAGCLTGPAPVPFAWTPDDCGFREAEVIMYQRILVPVDGSPTSDRALAAALQLARRSEAHVRLLHVVEELPYLSGYGFGVDMLGLARDRAQQILQSGLAAIRAAGVQGDTHLMEQVSQRLGETVAVEARGWKADLIVLGTHGRRGLSRVLLGSGAEQIIRWAPVAVLVVRGEDEDTSRPPLTASAASA